MIKMLKMILCVIPENVGWVMVGAIGMLCLMVLSALTWVAVEAITDRIKEHNFQRAHPDYEIVEKCEE